MRRSGLICSAALAVGRRRRHHGELRRATFPTRESRADGDVWPGLAWPGLPGPMVGGKRLNPLGEEGAVRGAEPQPFVLGGAGGSGVGFRGVASCRVTGTGVGRVGCDAAGRRKRLPGRVPDRAAASPCPAVRLRQSRPGAARHPKLRPRRLGGHQVSVRVPVRAFPCARSRAQVRVRVPPPRGGAGLGRRGYLSGRPGPVGAPCDAPRGSPVPAGLSKRLAAVPRRWLSAATTPARRGCCCRISSPSRPYFRPHSPTLCRLYRCPGAAAEMTLIPAVPSVVQSM